MRLIYITFLSTLFFSCITTSEEKNKTIISVSIQRVYTDSISIRAIQAVNDTVVWFAGSHGKVGLIEGKTPKLAAIAYDDKPLEFRAMAKTSNAFFVLNIGSPAIVYKLGVNANEASNIEEVYTETGEKVFYDAMKFWNNKEGIAMGDPIDGCLSVIITRDAGLTWQKLACDKLPKSETGEGAFAASNSNIAVYGSHAWIATGGKQARVFHSADKGETWEVFPTPILQGGAMTGIYSIDFYNEKIGVIFGGNWEEKTFNQSNKAITLDGGKTWSLLANGQEPGYRSCVKFIPHTEGMGLVAVGSPGISISQDRGATWNTISDEGFYAIDFVNDSIAFASGRHKISKLKFIKK
ncbi:MAG: oxidoreductase [Flavobacteriaceae bacterium]|nr:oxidoreductase [Flavobacteriaceae bacterium]